MKTLIFALLISFNLSAQVKTTDTTYFYLEDSLVFINARFDSIYTSFKPGHEDSILYKLVEYENTMFWVNEEGFNYKKTTYQDSTVSYEFVNNEWKRHFYSFTKRDTLWHNDGRCEGITKLGNRCKRNAKDNFHYCWQHL